MRIMKYKSGQILAHKYNEKYSDFFGYATILEISKHEVIISFSKDKVSSARIYQKSYVYSYEIISDIFIGEL